MKCPVCKGNGNIPEPHTFNTLPQLKKKAAHLLRHNGYGIREIQRLLGYKSPRSITKILEPKQRLLVVDDNETYVLQALDSLALALTDHHHKWTKHERAAYNKARNILTKVKR